MKLILLRCPNCSSALKPGIDDIIYACPNCSSAIHIEAEGPKIIGIQYAIPTKGKDGEEIWVPFWVFEGRVQIKKRETQGRQSNTKDSIALWGSPRRLYVPAWDLSIHTAQEVGSKLTQRQLTMRFVERPTEAQLTPATVSPADALNLLEFIVLAIEARRKDWLKELVFDLEVGEPELLALPRAAIS
ncbi:MAG: hypothetical protein WA996_19480 [Candidatus Promineifilaceae bacterium]